LERGEGGKSGEGKKKGQNHGGGGTGKENVNFLSAALSRLPKVAPREGRKRREGIRGIKRERGRGWQGEEGTLKAQPDTLLTQKIDLRAHAKAHVAG